jgi:hypothetical protein
LHDARYALVHAPHDGFRNRLALVNATGRPLTLRAQYEKTMNTGIKVPVGQFFDHSDIGFALAVEHGRNRYHQTFHRLA